VAVRRSAPDTVNFYPAYPPSSFVPAKALARAGLDTGCWALASRLHGSSLAPPCYGPHVLPCRRAIWPRRAEPASFMSH